MATRASKKPKVTEENNPVIASAPLSAAKLQDRISARAYEIYLSRNGTAGDDFNDWLLAEREVCTTPSNCIAVADDVMPTISATTKRKRTSTTKVSKLTTASSSKPKSKTASSTRSQKGKQVS